MKDMKGTAGGYDFRPAHVAMQRYVDGNILSVSLPQYLSVEIW
jgi:hypothetical protein